VGLRAVLDAVMKLSVYMGKILVGNPEGWTPLRRPRRTWGGNINMEVRDIRWEGLDWMHLSQDRDQWRVLVNTAMDLLVS
jgi:hypothetical protein